MKVPKLQNLKANVERFCPTCGEPFIGGLNQVYCSDGCKQEKKEITKPYRTKSKVLAELKADYFDTFPVMCSPCPDIGRD